MHNKVIEGKELIRLSKMYSMTILNTDVILDYEQ